MAEPDPYRYFRIEAAELVERLGQGALSIEKGEVPSGGVAALLRHAHTLKGAARVVKQIEIADRAHAIEDVLSPHRACTDALPRECARALFASIDAIGAHLAALAAPAPQPGPRSMAPGASGGMGSGAATPRTPPGITAAAGAPASGAAGSAASGGAGSSAAQPAAAASAAAALASPPGLAGSATAPAAIGSPEASADGASAAGGAPRADGAPGIEPAPQNPPRLAARPAKNEEAVTLRAEVAEVEAVVDGLAESLIELEALKGPLGLIEQARQLAELIERQLGAPRRADAERSSNVIERSQRMAEELRQRLARLDSGLRHGVGRVRRQLEETHASAERLRLVPASGIFLTLERAAYDAARELGRRIAFGTSGGDVKLDSHVLVVAQGALLHVVRNAVAHGIEPEAARVAAGKPVVGSIALEVSRRGHDVVFTCRDDGAGVDLERVRRALAQSGRDAGGMSDAQVLERLLHGGISTAAGVTRVSGRGVGLDVLRDAAEQLGGRARLDSVRGRGLSVELRVPLSIAAVTAVAVECAGRTMSVPLDRVVESVRFARAEIARTGTRESVCHDGRVVPFASLARVLGEPAPPPAPAWTALVLQGASGRAAVGVDRLLGARNVVLRPLPREARAGAVVAGATLDALGNPELVLDGDALVAEVLRFAGVSFAPPPPSRPILVIDDSLTTRMLEQSILESAGYEVALASSAEEGLEKAHEHPYALFLVDVEMPGIDGFTFVDRVRHDPKLSHVPAVLVSSRNAPEDFERGKAVGAHGYIVKGRFDQRELLGLIEKLVEN